MCFVFLTKLRIINSNVCLCVVGLLSLPKTIWNMILCIVTYGRRGGKEATE